MDIHTYNPLARLRGGVPLNNHLPGENTNGYTPSTFSQGRRMIEPPKPRIYIAVMGATGSGKSTFINLVAGASLGVGKGLASCTSVVQEAPCFELDGQLITFIDTPGFDDTTKSDTEILKMIALFLSTSYERGVKLCGIIYMHRISDNRMGGIANRNFSMFRKLCGDSTLKNVVIVTNMWNTIPLAEAEARETELREKDMFFKPVLDKHARLFRHDNTEASAQAILFSLIGQSPKALRIQRELVDEHKDITQTSAARTLNKELTEQAEKHAKEMEELHAQMQEAIREADEVTRKELEEQTSELRLEMERTKSERENWEREYREEKAKMEEKMRQINERAEREARQAEEMHRQQMDALRDELNQASAMERDAIHRKMAQLQNDYDSRRGFFYHAGEAMNHVIRNIKEIFD